MVAPRSPYYDLYAAECSKLRPARGWHSNATRAALQRTSLSRGHDANGKIDNIAIAGRELAVSKLDDSVPSASNDEGRDSVSRGTLQVPAR